MQVTNFKICPPKAYAPVRVPKTKAPSAAASVAKVIQKPTYQIEAEKQKAFILNSIKQNGAPELQAIIAKMSRISIKFDTEF